MCHSSWIHADPGVLQGTVLGPLIFLLHINDLPKSVLSQGRLFVDDCLPDDLQIWADKWRMNASKYHIMIIHRSTQPLEIFYTLNKQVLTLT